MEDFSYWSMQYAAEPCLAGHPSDDDVLFGAFLGGGFDLRSDHGGLNLPSSHPFQTNFMPSHGGASLSVSDGFMGLDTADMFASVTGALDDGGLLDTFAYGSGVVDAAAEEPAQPTASSNAFSGYSSTTGGYGNISSGESNTCGGGGGGHDTEVASSPCALPRPALPQATAAPASKRKLSKYPAIAAATSTEAQVAAPRCGTKRDSATSSSSTSITFAAGGHGDHHHHAVGGSSSSSIGVGGEYEPDSEAIAQVKEMIYRAAAMRPVHQLVCGVAEPSSSPNKPRRKNVRISSDPQTVAARLRRGRVSERLRVLQRLVPGGSRMDTASMLGEAASYLKFLKSQVKALERANPSSGGYHNSSPLPQSYTGSLGGGTSASTVPDFGGDGAIGGYVKSDRNMHL